jgi:hypothetical protein
MIFLDRLWVRDRLGCSIVLLPPRRFSINEKTGCAPVFSFLASDFYPMLRLPRRLPRSVLLVTSLTRRP